MIYPGSVSMLTAYFFRAKVNDSPTWNESLARHKRLNTELYNECRCLAESCDKELSSVFYFNAEQRRRQPPQSSEGSDGY